MDNEPAKRDLIGESPATPPSPPAHTHGTNYSIDADKREDYLAFVERLRRLKDEHKSISEDIKALKGEAKGVGLDPAALDLAVKRLNMSEEAREREDEKEERVNLIVGWVRRYS